MSYLTMPKKVVVGVVIDTGKPNDISKLENLIEKANAFLEKRGDEFYLTGQTEDILVKGFVVYNANSIRAQKTMSVGTDDEQPLRLLGAASKYYATSESLKTMLADIYNYASGVGAERVLRLVWNYNLRVEDKNYTKWEAL